ncbi:hypothetical protein LCGC14_2990100 [marine sediment metagenome]|uniref:DUF3800 domain-containing protein n=1 Tax=marine sediment metagenome TaxID=412755 RepID=A0A0F8X4V4_9ZZZZ
MHFYYLDESGDTGGNLNDIHQPVMVLGGVSIRDEGWNQTHTTIQNTLRDFFQGQLPDDFELHADDLLSPAGAGCFCGIEPERRYQLAIDLLQILNTRSHNVHYLAIDKGRLRDAAPLNMVLSYNPRRPYLLAFDYLVTYINWIVKNRLGRSARGMIILDRKEQFHEDIERIMRDRRYQGPQAHRVKWVVEFSYPIDSRKNPMIQYSDLAIYCIRRFIELENGYRENWTNAARDFCARCYAVIRPRVQRLDLVERGGQGMARLNNFVSQVRIEPRTQWRRHYNLNG